MMAVSFRFFDVRYALLVHATSGETPVDPTPVTERTVVPLVDLILPPTRGPVQGLFIPDTCRRVWTLESRNSPVPSP